MAQTNINSNFPQHDHIAFILRRGQSRDHLSRVNRQGKKHFTFQQTVGRQVFRKQNTFIKKNVSNITFKPDPCLNSDEHDSNQTKD